MGARGSIFEAEIGRFRMGKGGGEGGPIIYCKSEPHGIPCLCGGEEELWLSDFCSNVTIHIKERSEQSLRKGSNLHLSSTSCFTASIILTHFYPKTLLWKFDKI